MIRYSAGNKFRPVTTPHQSRALFTYSFLVPSEYRDSAFGQTKLEDTEQFAVKGIE